MVGFFLGGGVYGFHMFSLQCENPQKPKQLGFLWGFGMKGLVFSRSCWGMEEKKTSMKELCPF